MSIQNTNDSVLRTTRRFAFGCHSLAGDNLFSVNEGVRVAEVIDKARLLVITAVSTLNKTDENIKLPGSFYAAVTCLELAEALLNSVDGCVLTGTCTD